ncbi:hypothetical protein HPB49_023231 [Dermacentor silvarum]|uniref:Uncharacterized protein n=1 Tax=Dermacentor silvarum TaxID=543639 RepID=A0ACB8E405_DERSI|nr:hypothetical protein HPB49_023231 [Dermacentor silvarum]
MKPSEAIFCFLPGWNEINNVRAELCEGAPAKFDNWNLPLQSRLRYQEQQKIFENPPADVRKVILSTNLAETSVTVDDVVYVVGTGLHRDQCLLGTFPTLMASVQQRAGRAGRVRSGESCHLITQNEFLSWDQFKRPELQTTDLTTVVFDHKTIAANAPHLPDDEIEEEASGRDVVPDNAGAKRTIYDIMTGRQLTVSSKSSPRIDRELMAKVEKSWKYYQRARLQLPIFARRGFSRIQRRCLGLHPPIRSRDTLPYVLTMLNSTKAELHSDMDGFARLHARKLLRLGNVQDVDVAMLTWFNDACSQGVPVSGPKLEEKARQSSHALDIMGFE